MFNRLEVLQNSALCTALNLPRWVPNIVLKKHAVILDIQVDVISFAVYMSISNCNILVDEYSDEESKYKKFNFFTLLALPLELIVYILKIYISVFDKIYTLFEIPEFSVMLTPSSSWYKSALNFANLMYFVKPG